MAAPKTRRRGSGEGSIYQRASDGRWVAAVDLGLVVGPDGRRKRKRVTVTAKTQATVLRKARGLRRQTEQGVTPTKDSVGAWLDRWLETVVEPQKRPTTVQGYRSKVKLLKSYIGTIKLSKLTPDDLRGMYAAMQKQGLSPGSIRGVRAVLQSALTVAVNDQTLIRNVAEVAKPPARIVRPHPVLTVDEAGTVLQHHTGLGRERELARLTCALLLGLRQGEALGLQWPDITLAGETGALRVRRSVHRIKGQGLVVDQLKNDRAARVIPLPAVAAVVLAAWRDRGPGWGWVFHGFAGPDSPESAERDHRAWKAALDRAGVPEVPLHGARGTTASLLLAMGVPDRMIADILGHDVRTSQIHYQHSDESQRLDALARLGDQLGLTVGSIAAAPVAQPVRAPDS